MKFVYQFMILILMIKIDSKNNFQAITF